MLQCTLHCTVLLVLGNMEMFVIIRFSRSLLSDFQEVFIILSGPSRGIVKINYNDVPTEICKRGSKSGELARVVCQERGFSTGIVDTFVDPNVCKYITKHIILHIMSRFHLIFCNLTACFLQYSFLSFLFFSCHSQFGRWGYKAVYLHKGGLQ